MSRFKRSVLLFSAIFMVVKCFGANGVEAVKDGPIHEAFMTREFGGLILDAIPTEPPEEINERIPAQTDPQAQWIPGYWAWSQDRNDYLWVSGVWRKPPPGHQWIGGYWKDFDEGSVWIPGFWSEIPETRLEYINEPPPDAIDERIPPAPSQDYFWITGHWFWDSSQNDYVWYGGKWELFDQNWVFVPAHYLWREEGYVFIPSYWDWPLEIRGVIYSAVSIDPGERLTIYYEPFYVIDPCFSIQSYYPWWPDYMCLYHYYFHFHPDFCNSLGMVPPWWWWDSWWGFGWHDAWWLFWWWGHPGFPHPFWLEAQFAAMIAPPPGFVLSLLSQVLPPPFILSDGVVGPNELIDAIEEVTGNDEPIMPSDQDEVEEIQSEAVPETTPDRPYLKPTGPAPDKVTPAPSKPSFGPENGDLRKHPRVTKPPAKPTVPPPTKPKPPRKPKPPIRRIKPRPSRPPTYTPPTTRPTQPPTYRTPRRPPTTYQPTQPQPSERPTYTPPSRRQPPTSTPPSTTQPPTYTPPSRTRPPTTYQPPTTAPSETQPYRPRGKKPRWQDDEYSPSRRIQPQGRVRQGPSSIYQERGATRSVPQTTPRPRSGGQELRQFK